MIKDVESGEVKRIIVKDMLRFGRDYLKVGYYTEVYFVEKNVHFIAINDGVDNRSETDSDFTPFRNIINEMVRERYVEESTSRSESQRQFGKTSY